MTHIIKGFSIVNETEIEAFLELKESTMTDCNAGDPGLIPRSGGSSGEGNHNPLQYSCLG